MTASNRVEYSFDPRLTGLSLGTRFDFTQITINIPENTSRVFKSVILEVSCRQSDAAATSLTEWLMGIKLGAVAFDDVTITDTITNSGEESSWLFRRDVTSYFSTNFGSGTSQTCQAGVTFQSVGVINLCARLIITYEYDETSHSTTRIKTVRIPMESTVAVLTNTATEMGTNQWPNLDTFLPEASKTIRDVFLEIRFNEAATATTDFQFGFTIDSGSEVLDGSHECALNSACWYQLIYKYGTSPPATNAAHAFKVRATVTSRCWVPCVVLVVTYEYDHSSSSTILNSLVIPFHLALLLGGTASSDASIVRVPVWVEEPTTISLVQSAIQVYFSTDGDMAGLNIAVGAQSYRAYTHVTGSLVCGDYCCQQRIDSGGAQGAALTLARGLNYIEIKGYRTDSTNLGWGVGGLLFLNYTSGKASGGADKHNHTLMYSVVATAADDAANTERQISAMAPNIPESNWFINSIGYEMIGMTLALRQTTQLGPQLLSGEAINDQVNAVLLGQRYNGGAGELGIHVVHSNATKLFKKTSQESSHRLDPEGSRKYYLTCSAQYWAAAALYLTYHSITFTVSGTVTAYAGNGEGLTAEIVRAGGFEIGEYVGTTTTASDAFTKTVFDSAYNHFVRIREDSTHVGSSNDGTPS